MNRQFLLILAGSLVAVGLVVFLTVEQNQRTVLHLDGNVTASKLVSFTDGATLAMVDFTATNPTQYTFEVNEIQVEAVKDGKTFPSRVFGKKELADYLAYQQYTPPNPQMGYGEVIKAGEKARRMAAARFEMTMDDLKGAEFVVRLIDINHVTSELKQKQEKKR